MFSRGMKMVQMALAKVETAKVVLRKYTPQCTTFIIDLKGYAMIGSE